MVGSSSLCARIRSMRSLSKVALPNASDVYAAFRKLNSRRRRDVALRILKDERVLADLYDHLLIKHAEDEPGASIAWEDYCRDRP